MPGEFSGPDRSRFVRSTSDPGPLPSNDEDIAFASVTQLSRWIEQRKLTSERLTNIYLTRLERFDPKLRCVITLTRDLALQQAKNADAEIALPAGRIDRPAELLHHLRPAHQGARQELRKEGDVERVSVERIERRLAAPKIDQIHDVMEGEEGDAERQRQIDMRHRLPEQQREIGRGEIGIFEDAEPFAEGDLGLLSDVGLPEAVLSVILDETDLYADEQLGRIAREMGFADELSSVLDKLGR